jgi:alkanesulfonate monooxygenase SsuD/methylene tetrahydromethanopterin reductase-like flavin-dependent oxidoreductase (luciferase family)
MQYGFVIPFGDPELQVDLAVEIERAGWDAAFTWETIYQADPWVVLGAMAARTERVRLGPLLTPPSRRRPWKLASEVATVDRLSKGRAVLCVGLGALETGFAEVGEETGRRERAELMDECLEICDRLWSGGPFTFEGKHYTVDWSRYPVEPFRPAYRPVQEPRPPIWCVAKLGAEKPMRRALRWDGCLPYKQTADNPYASLEPADVSELRAWATANADGDRRFHIALEGTTPIGDRAVGVEKVEPLAEAGATWWIESRWDDPGGVDAIRARIAQGPPRP